MLIVSVRGLYEDAAASYQTEWGPLVEHLARCAPSVEPRKESVPLLNFAEFRGGIRLEHVVQVHAAMLDYDKVAHEDMCRVLAQAQQFRGFAYTTHSHGIDGMCRFRVALALDRPCPAPQWEHVWRRLARTLGTFHPKAPDKQTRDPGRFFFQPATNPASGLPCWFQAWDGPCLNLDRLLEPDPTAGTELIIESELEQSERVAFSDIQVLAKRLAGKSDSTLSMIGRALSTALRGEAYAAEGYRNDLTYKMAGELGKAFPRADAGDLAEKFRAAFELQGEPTPEQFAGMVRRQQLKHQQYELERRAARQLRSGEEPTPAPGEPVPAPALPLVVQRAGYFWFRRPDSDDYDRVFGKDDVALAFLRDFSGTVDTIGADMKPIPIKQQLDLYGQVALRVDATYLATKNTFDPENRTLTLATSPRRAGLQAQHVLEVHEWLHALAGDRYLDLLHWIQGLFRLDWPCPALYLWGPKHTGKTMLARGLAHIWREPFTKFATVLQSFNAGLAANPVVLADEGFPPETKFTFVREFLTESVRSVNEKYRPHFNLRGYVRLIVTANNPAAFEHQRRGLTLEDTDAIGERVVQLHVADAARKFLLSLGSCRITEEKIARHALWLAEQATEQPTGRWVMQPTTAQTSEFQASLVDSDYGWFVDWLAGYILSPRSVEMRYASPGPDGWLVRTYQGRLLIAHRAYKYIDDCEPSRFQRALRFFSDPDPVPLHVPGDHQRKIKYRSINLRRFYDSAQEQLEERDVIATVGADTLDRLQSTEPVTKTRPNLRAV